MPRELAHFLAIEGAIGSIDELKSAVERIPLAREVLYLGSITPDAPYYVLFGEKHERIAAFLHGRDGADSFSLPRMLREESKKLPLEKKELVNLFIIGILSHIILDAIVHPFVNLLSGDYYDPDPHRRREARTLHRRLETDLDCFLKSSIQFENSKYECLLRLSSNLSPVLEELGVAMDDSLKSLNFSCCFTKYWRSHSLLYSILGSDLSAYIRNFLPVEIAALCGAGRAMHPLFQVKEFFYPNSDNLYFRHESGKENLLSVYLLAKDFLLTAISEYLENPDKYLSLRGPSLEDGTI